MFNSPPQPDHPFTTAHVRYTCPTFGPGNKNDSIAGRNKHSVRESMALHYVVRKAKRSGNTVFFGTFNFGTFVDAQQIKSTISHFSKIMRIGSIRWRGYFEAHADNKVHLHAIFISDKDHTQHVTAAWHNSLKKVLGTSYCPKSTKTRVEKAKSNNAYLCYITGNTTEKKKRPWVFKKKIGFPTTVGSRGFFGMPLRELIKHMARRIAAFKIADAEGDPRGKTLEHYMELAEKYYRQEQPTHTRSKRSSKTSAKSQPKTTPLQDSSQTHPGQRQEDTLESEQSNSRNHLTTTDSKISHSAFLTHFKKAISLVPLFLRRGYLYLTSVLRL